MSALQVISYEFTEPSCGEMPYYVSSFLMHIQPCIIVERMLQTAQLTLQNGVKPKSESTMLCPECFFRFVWWFTNSHLNEICEFQLLCVLCMILYDLICSNMWIRFSDSIICFPSFFDCQGFKFQSHPAAKIETKVEYFTFTLWWRLSYIICIIQHFPVMSNIIASNNQE